MSIEKEPSFEQSLNVETLPVAYELNYGLALAEQMVRRKLEVQPVVLVAVVGGSAAGKTEHIAPRLAGRFTDTCVLAEDDYCLGNSGSSEIYGQPNLQHFPAYDPGRIFVQLEQLKDGYSVEVPQFAFDERERKVDTKTVLSRPVVIMEGSFLLQEPMVEIFDVRIFVDTDDHSRFVRRMLRSKRNPLQKDSDRVKEYCEWFYPAYYRETSPFRKNADIRLSNPYNVEEALKKLEDHNGDLIIDESAVLSRSHYMHVNMTESELLVLIKLKNGDQVIRYFPDVSRALINKTLIVPSSDYVVDLTKVGYSLIN